MHFIRFLLFYTVEIVLSLCFFNFSDDEKLSNVGNARNGG